MSLETSVDDTPLTFDSPSLDWKETPAPDSSSESNSSADASAPASSPEAATVPPVDTPPADAKPRDSAGPIPFDRHQAILTAERERREALETQLSWASELLKAGKTPEQVQRALAIESGLSGNSVGFIEQLLTEAAAHPGLAGQVRSVAARILGTGRATQVEAPAQEDIEPKPDRYLDHPDGTRDWFRSAENLQAWEAWRSRALRREFEERLKPFEEVRQDLESRRQREASEAQYREEYQRHYDEGAKLLDELKKEPYFNDDFQKSMREYVAANKGASIKDAWLHVLRTKTVPMSTEQGRANAIADLRTKAAASSVAPKAAASGVPSGPKSFFDPSLNWKA